MSVDGHSIYNGILLSYKKHKVMPFAATWMNLEIIILSEVKSYREKQISYDITYMENLKRKWYKQTYLQNRLTDVENKFMITKGETVERDKLGIGD